MVEVTSNDEVAGIRLLYAVVFATESRRHGENVPRKHGGTEARRELATEARSQRAQLDIYVFRYPPGISIQVCHRVTESPRERATETRRHRENVPWRHGATEHNTTYICFDFLSVSPWLSGLRRFDPHGPCSVARCL